MQVCASRPFIFAFLLTAFLLSHELVSKNNGVCDMSSIAASNLLSGPSCQSLLDPASNRDPKEMAYTQSYGYLYDFESSEKRISPIRNGKYLAVIRDIRSLSRIGTPQMSVVTHIQEMTTDLPDTEFVPDDALAEFDKTRARLVQLAIKFYRERRGWPESFLTKLNDLSIEYLNESIYIESDHYERTYAPTGEPQFDDEPRGTIRFIRERDGLLPMEKYLDITVDVGGKHKVEPGNFAVEKEERYDAWAELFMRAETSEIRNLGQGRENHYLTYADDASYLMYSQLKLRPVPADRIHLKPDAVTRVYKGRFQIQKDGKWWTPMECSQATIDSLATEHIKTLQTYPQFARFLSHRQYDQAAEYEENPYTKWHFIGEADFRGKKYRAGLTIDLRQRPRADISLRLYDGTGKIIQDLILADDLLYERIPYSYGQTIYTNRRLKWSFLDDELKLETPRGNTARLKANSRLRQVSSLSVSIQDSQGHDQIEVRF